MEADLLNACKLLVERGYNLYGTEGTAKYLVENGVPAERVIWPTEAEDPELGSVLIDPAYIEKAC